MTRRDWWIGTGLIVASLLAHAAFPRYEWRDPGEDFNALAYIRIDRWTGRAQWGPLLTFDRKNITVGKLLPLVVFIAVAENVRRSHHSGLILLAHKLLLS